MKTAEKLASSWLLILGFMFLTISTTSMVEKNSASKSINPRLDRDGYLVFTSPTYVSELSNKALQGFIFGVPCTVLGGWMALSLYRQGKQEKKALKQQTDDRLQSLFYQMVQENHGRVTLLRFAMQSQLPPTTAKDYLDDKAKEFNANFKISEEGAVSYFFEV
ncbi:MAG: hypothetical protein HC903_09425 [Methylacidiphilales bacterium]|nr:hypothetical protein [Candidatus Methylacidiphilales bacterium]NJR15909.1 hypothetical protein [Calothrix sp. CSU_2_0]